MKDIIDVLQEAGALAHWTVWPHKAARGEELACAPIIAWRHEQPSQELAELFRQVVGTFQGATSWEFSAAGRRWVLMPARIREYSESHGCLGELMAAAELRVADPDFGKRANAELGLLAEHIHHGLMGRRAARGQGLGDQAQRAKDGEDGSNAASGHAAETTAEKALDGSHAAKAPMRRSADSSSRKKAAG